MKSNQYHFLNSQWQTPLPNDSQAQLVFVFGCRVTMADALFNQSLMRAFPNADIVGCTTSGEIKGDEIFDNTVVVSELIFDKTDIKVNSVQLNDFENFSDAVKALTESLPTQGLKYAVVISDGQNVNGTELVNLLSALLPSDTILSGGLAGDSARFNETVVWHNQNIGPEQLVLCGFYGEHIEMGHGNLGGWVPFGPERLVTKSEGNVLYSLDGESALDLYKEYLGEYAADLPASALRFPLYIKPEGSDEFMVRTILNIDNERNSLIFTGDIPQGCHASLMRANTSMIVDGAEGAAKQALEVSGEESPDFALLISCVGRRMLLQQETEFELESVQEVLGKKCLLGGFYSYGELSPMAHSKKCALHNQTMTITTFKERG